jgi:hypothetical protein
VGSDDDAGHARPPGCDNVIGVSAIEIDAGDFAIEANREIAAPALFAERRK